MPKENQLKGRKTCGVLTSVALNHGHLTLLLLLSMVRQDIMGNVWWDQVAYFMVCRRQRERQREGDRIRQRFQTCPCDLLPPGRNPLCKLRLSMGPSMDGVNVLMVQSTLPPFEIKSFLNHNPL